MRRLVLDAPPPSGTEANALSVASGLGLLMRAASTPVEAVSYARAICQAGDPSYFAHANSCQERKIQAWQDEETYAFFAARKSEARKRWLARILTDAMGCTRSPERRSREPRRRNVRSGSRRTRAPAGSRSGSDDPHPAEPNYVARQRRAVSGWSA